VGGDFNRWIGFSKCGQFLVVVIPPAMLPYFEPRFEVAESEDRKHDLK
jgi:hypothetical protein